MHSETSSATEAVSVTESAAKRIAVLLKEEDRPNLMLRVAVNGGGCSGFSYDFKFDDTMNDDDTAIERDGVTVLIDEISMEYLAGSQIDYVENLIGAAFQISNPNAAASCGCGSSFSI